MRNGEESYELRGGIFTADGADKRGFGKGIRIEITIKIRKPGCTDSAVKDGFHILLVPVAPRRSEYLGLVRIGRWNEFGVVHPPRGCSSARNFFSASWCNLMQVGASWCN